MSRVDTTRFSASLPRLVVGTSPTRALAELDSKQSGLLARLQSDDSQREVLTSMMMSNTLMELTKLSWGRLGIGEFALATLNTLAQCTPLEGCVFTFNAIGLPPVYCAIGDWPAPEDLDKAVSARLGTKRELFTVPVFGRDSQTPIGYIGVSGMSVSLLDAGLLDRAAEFLSSTLSLLIEAEHLRRAAAASKAIELVGGLSDAYDESHLVEIVSTIQTLPGAVAAKLTIEVPRFAGPLEIEAGLLPIGSEPTERTQAIDQSGSCTLNVWWGDSAGEPSDSRLSEIVERLCASLSRSEQTSRLLSEVETDELTGIGNRRCASKALAQASARARRIGEEYAVLLMDLDRFKTVNDRLGHDIGDAVLCSFSKALQRAIRGYDVAARWGGEEFLLVCPSTNQQGAEALAQRLLSDTPVLCGEVLPEDWHQTVSIGITVCQNPDIDPIELVKVADAAMYEAKMTGRNRYVFSMAKVPIRI